jgi:hypothetical protein
VDAGTRIKFVASKRVSRGGVVTIPTPTTAGVTKVRVTLGGLSDFGVGRYRYRGAISEVLVSSSVTKQNKTTYHKEGDYDDYTEIVKWVCAWGGFHWPKNANSYIIHENGDKATITPANHDPILGIKYGRVWGDFETAGTKSLGKFDAETWDKQPLMEIINYIKDILGYVFLIDEAGGVIWRRQNYWGIGNWIRVVDQHVANPGVFTIGPLTPTRTSNVITLDENETLLNHEANLTSRPLRNYVFVGDVTGKLGATAVGFEFRSAQNKPRSRGYGLRRVGGWTDQHFASQDECQMMADLIALRQMFAARSTNVRIPGNPAIQVDDQVRVRERVTADTYYHYVKGITSNYDAASGVWEYTLNLNWLGETPFDIWAFNPDDLSDITKEFLKAVGII